MKSGAIASSGGDVGSIISEGAEKNAGTTNLAENARLSCNKPDEQTLPKGHCIVSNNTPSNAISVIIGEKQTNMKKFILHFPGTCYQMEGNSMTI